MAMECIIVNTFGQEEAMDSTFAKFRPSASTLQNHQYTKSVMMRGHTIQGNYQEKYKNQ